MSVIQKYIVFQLVIVFPFAFGYFTRHRFPTVSENVKKIIRINLYLLEPLIVFWSIWGLQLSRELILLPISGLVLVVSARVYGSFFADRFHLSKKSKASFIISSSLSNHGGTMGGFLCYLVLGERGLALSFIFLLYFFFYTYIYIFSYAQKISSTEKSSDKNIFQMFFQLHNMPFFAAIAALLLNLLQFKRPVVMFSFDPIILFSIGLAYFTLGLTFEFGKVKSAWRENFLLVIVKFVLTPLTAIFLIALIPLSDDVRSVILIESFMPVAVYSVITSVFFDLDSKLSSVLFVVNNLLFMSVVLPGVLIIRKLFF
jgi:predicted permease